MKEYRVVIYHEETDKYRYFPWSTNKIDIDERCESIAKVVADRTCKVYVEEKLSK